MARLQRYLLVALGVLLLGCVIIAQQDDTQDNASDEQKDAESGSQESDSNSEDSEQPTNGESWKQQWDNSYDEQLSLVEFEFFDTDLTMYGEDFVDSINNILKSQALNSTVIGVLVTDQAYEESRLVATLILSYYNYTILSQLGDLEDYIFEYIYKNQNQMSIQAARVSSVHSRKVSSLSSKSEKYHKGWAFLAGSSTNPDGSIESKSTETIATVRYNKVVFSLGHTHSFGYGVDERSLVQTNRQVAELDDDYIEWNGFKVFHMRNPDTVSDSTKEWKSMTWSESSLQRSAETTWSNRGKGHMGIGAVTGTVISVVSVAVVVISIVGYVLLRRMKRKINSEDTSSIDKCSAEVTDGINEQTALV